MANNSAKKFKYEVDVQEVWSRTFAFKSDTEQLSGLRYGKKQQAN